MARETYKQMNPIFKMLGGGGWGEVRKKKCALTLVEPIENFLLTTSIFLKFQSLKTKS